MTTSPADLYCFDEVCLTNRFIAFVYQNYSLEMDTLVRSGLLVVMHPTHPYSGQRDLSYPVAGTFQATPSKETLPWNWGPDVCCRQPRVRGKDRRQSIFSVCSGGGSTRLSYDLRHDGAHVNRLVWVQDTESRNLMWNWAWKDQHGMLAAGSHAGAPERKTLSGPVGVWSRQDLGWDLYRSDLHTAEAFSRRL